MSVQSLETLKRSAGNGSATAFPFSGKVYSPATIQVKTRIDATGVTVVQTRDGLGTYDYTLAIASDNNSATVTFNTAPPTGYTVLIERIEPLTQLDTYLSNDTFQAKTLEKGLDRLVLISQQLAKSVQRSLQFSPIIADGGASGTVTLTLEASDRANKVLSFDPDGKVTVTQAIGNWRGVWATATSYSLRDIVKDAVTTNIYICAVAHVSGSLSADVSAGKFVLILDLKSAADSATAAASNASTASSKAVLTALDVVSTHADVVSTHADVVLTHADVVLTHADVVSTHADANSSASSASAAAASAASVPSDVTLQKGNYWYATTSGTDTYTCTLSPVPSQLPKFLYLKIGSTNTGASTINPNSLGATSIKNEDGSALSAGNLTGGNAVLLIYDGTNYILATPTPTPISTFNSKLLFIGGF